MSAVFELCVRWPLVDPMFYSIFGTAFSEAMERSHARSRRGTFSLSVIEVNADDLPAFIEALAEGCEE